MSIKDQTKSWPYIVTTAALCIFLSFIPVTSGFAKSSKVGISPQIIGPNKKTQTFDFTFSLDGGHQNTFEISSSPSCCKKLILLGFMQGKDRFWVRKSKNPPQEEGYTTWDFDPDLGLLTIRTSSQKTPREEIKITFSAHGLYGQGPFEFTLRTYEEGRREVSFKFTDRAFRKSSD